MRRAIRILVVAAGLGALCFCGEARALFVGVDENSNVADNGGGTDQVGDASNTDSGRTAASGERIVNPFDKAPALNMPETMPEEVVRQAGKSYNRPHNSKRFDRLLGGGADTPAAAHPAVRTPDKENAAPAPKPSHALDYLIGAIAVAGVGVVGYLLLRGRATT